jgi:hypothetical protein
VVWIYVLAIVTLTDALGWLGFALVIFFPPIVPFVPIYLAFHGHWGPLLGIGIGIGLFAATLPRDTAPALTIMPEPEPVPPVAPTPRYLKTNAELEAEIQRQLGQRND